MKIAEIKAELVKFPLYVWIISYFIVTLSFSAISSVLGTDACKEVTAEVAIGALKTGIMVWALLNGVIIIISSILLPLVWVIAKKSQ